MTAPNPLQAAAPGRNASVHASAGTGKTWLLVTRIVRLLLAGAPVESILAVTFTRKAAAEMQQRVSERLRALAGVDDAALEAMLRQLGVTPEAATRERARGLYEALLFHPYALRATTFHAFCQELLQRFPLEAGVTPGFAISETTGLLEQSAWDALVAGTAAQPDGPVAQALDRLVEGCGGLGAAQQALRSFLAHRSDWWAYTQGARDPQRLAAARLAEQLGVAPGTDPLAGFPGAPLREALREFAELLARNTSKTNAGHSADLVQALAADAAEPAAVLAAIRPVFFKTDGEPRERKAAAAQVKRLGQTGEARFLALHGQIVAELQQLQERLARCGTLDTTLAWYTAGTQLLAHYQRIKQEQRVLDFADLEWLACELLNRSAHASWVQYKLDSRIDHLLVDEFQDTNPTQWRLLLPLLQELAAGSDGRARSVFLVGDRKQSIYGFRRANPALLEEAADWLQAHLQAQRYPLDASRRSAGAIIDCVNAVFGSPPLAGLLAGFNRHSTHLGDSYGRVELLPLVDAPAAADAEAPGAGLRNPLHMPRPDTADRRHYAEGAAIAACIRGLAAGDTLVSDAHGSRRLQYGDIMILLRQRTHASAYEHALRDAGIPYLSASRGMLLDNLEVRDLEALLRLLVSPYDNLALAQVLRSPVFGLDSEQLLPLAGHASGTWYEHLGGLAAAGEPPYDRVYPLLSRWRSLAGQLPVHDLLDRIFHEAELPARYTAAFPEALAPRVQASLTRFIELALEVDNGRYPSLPRFLDQLEQLRQTQGDQPDESPPAGGDGNRVRIMTIHAAKGLEAPVVFLADSATVPRDRNAHAALVDWPGDRDRPAHFLLAPRRADLDPLSRQLLDRQAQAQQREDANLLYVAITRARQYLYLSASAPARGSDTGWYGLLQDALRDWPRNAAGNPCRVTGTTPAAADLAPAARPHPVAVDPRLRQAIPVAPQQRQIAPSHAGGAVPLETGDPDGRERGIAIHCMLDRLSRLPGTEPGLLLPQLAQRLGREAADPDFLAWWAEAVATWRDPGLAPVFDPRHFQRARNEVPLQYSRDGQLVYGVIDRLVVRADSVLVIDYKTHRGATPATLPALADSYREQLRLYAGGVARLWPGQAVKPCLLFTACNTLVELD